jgi:chromosome segregation ATPase
VSQPEVTGPHGFWSVDDQSRYQWSRVASHALLQLSTSTLDQQTLVQGIEQVCSLHDEQLSRIYHLEQALDQALLYLDELRVRVRDQGILETQLATTEEFSSIQQQAIAQLKLQLERQQQATEMYRAGMGDRDHVFLQLIDRINTAAAEHCATLERFQKRLDADRDETAAHYHRFDQTIKELQTELENRQRQILTLEAEALSAHSRVVELEMQLSASNQRIRELYVRLEERSAQSSPSVVDLPAELAPPRLDSDAGDTVAPSALESPSANGQDPNGNHLEPRDRPSEVEHSVVDELPEGQSTIQKLATAMIRIQELEDQMDQQGRQVAKLQHQSQELEAERDRQQSRMTDLDNQNAEMQEQILKQAKEASEYEAAVQHWKDRYISGQRQMHQLRELLHQMLPNDRRDKNGDEDELRPVLNELLSVIDVALTPEHDDILDDAGVVPHFSTLDVPDFLLKRRLRSKRSPKRPHRAPKPTASPTESDAPRANEQDADTRDRPNE